MAMSPRDPSFLDRWDPFAEMTSLRDAMNRLFETSFVWPGNWGGGSGSRMSVPLEISETENEYRVEAALPGIKPSDVNISIQDNVLTVQGERREAHERREGERTSYSEQRYGSFSRSITLPMPINADQAKAEFHDGVLCLTLPKSEAARPKQIPIRMGEETSGQAQRQEVQAPGAGVSGGITSS